MKTKSSKKAKRIASQPRICVLGSTGSIGCQALYLLSSYPRYKIELLSAKSNWKLLVEQARKFTPRYIALSDERFHEKCKSAIKQLSPTTTFVTNVEDVCTNDTVSHVLVASTGVSSLPIIEKVIRKSKIILLANKESMVVAGKKIMALVKKYNATLFPLDSEPHAILKCIDQDYWHNNLKCPPTVKSLVLTASGGPFLHKTKKELKNVTLSQAINHPTWKMGKKISVESATMVNKAFELIECSRLFSVNQDAINVVIHPNSIVHSMVEYRDGSFKAEIAEPDMKIPIADSLFYPDLLFENKRSIDLFSSLNMSFKLLNKNNIPIRLARQSLEIGEKATTVYSAANDCIVNSFIKGTIPFHKIIDYIQIALNQFNPSPPKTIADCYKLYHEIWQKTLTEIIK